MGLNFTAYGDVTLIDISTAFFILLIAFFISKVIALNLRRSLKEKMVKDNLEAIIKLLSYIIIGIAIIATLPILGLDPSGLILAGGIIAIVIGIASQSIVGNIIGGIFLMIERPLKIGDVVNVDGITGIVEDIQIISISVRTFDGVYVRLPNEKVFTSNITNFKANIARRFQYKVGIRYRDDADKAIEIIQEIIDKQPFALKNPAPLVFVDELGDNAVVISTRIWAPSTEWWDVRTKLLWVIKKTLEEKGIEIAFPQRTLWFANSTAPDNAPGEKTASLPAGNGSQVSPVEPEGDEISG